jgi:beta-lactam-binding protein with PASTA domain
VRGQLLEEAQQQLEAKGISFRLRERPSSDPPGTVLQQYPQGGASVGRRSQVTLYVSPPTHEPRPED